MDDLEALKDRCRENKRRYRVLERCLTLAEGLRRAFSRNQAAISPEQNCGPEFDVWSETVDTLREMLLELRPVIEADAKKLDWNP